MIDRPEGGERALLVQLALPGLDADNALAEFKELAISAGAEVLGEVRGERKIPEAKYYVGLGKALEIQEAVRFLNIELVLINHDLSPSQERNLEQLLSCRVVSRSGLILDIFAQRARTFEGKLQVELAQLEHLSTRLIRGWTHLERQKGGIGLRGPGETQLESDRRLLRDRIKVIQKRLEKVRKGREQNRQARQKSHLPLISLVGYTNAGKSTLFNALTGDKSYVANKLFATLDPTLRKIDLPGSTGAYLIDTVGFIRDLPHQLIEAFRATLEETQQASLLLHVIDISNPNWQETVEAVEKVLDEIGVSKNVPILPVYNKIDQMEGFAGGIRAVGVSALTGEGIPRLLERIADKLFGKIVEKTIHILPEQAKLRAYLYQIHAVVEEKPLEDGGWDLYVRLSQEQYQVVLGEIAS
jgi:GTP-binding protein HflX